MSRWFRMYDDLLDDPKVQRLDPEDFRAEFNKALRGETSAFEAFIFPEFGRLPWDAWSIIRLSVFERDSFTCRYCGKGGGKLECDHVIPVSKGGSHKQDNLVTSCRDCNRKKANKTLEELGWELVA